MKIMYLGIWLLLIPTVVAQCTSENCDDSGTSKCDKSIKLQLSALQEQLSRCQVLYNWFFCKACHDKLIYTCTVIRTFVVYTYLRLLMGIFNWFHDCLFYDLTFSIINIKLAHLVPGDIYPCQHHHRYYFARQARHVVTLGLVHSNLSLPKLILKSHPCDIFNFCMLGTVCKSMF